MDTNKILRIYQTYSIDKISALSKKSLAMQYEQNGQLAQLNRQLAANNDTSNRILRNQIKELERQENVRFYKNLIFKMKLVLDKIEKQPVINYKIFLSSLFLKPIETFSKEAIDILEEIKDKEYALQLIEQKNAIVLSNKNHEIDYNQSAWASYFVAKEAYNDNQNKLAIRKKEFEIKKLEEKRDKEKKKNEKRRTQNIANRNVLRKIKKIFSTGCLIISILFFLMVTAAAITDLFSKNELGVGGAIFVIAIFAIPVVVSWKLRKKSLQDTEEKMNEVVLEPKEIILDECEQKIIQLKNDVEVLESQDKKNKTVFETISTAINAECGNWEEQLKEIIELLPHEIDINAKEKVNKDPLLEKVAKLVVDCQLISPSLIQRQFSVGYNRANRIVEQLEQIGIIAKEENGTLTILCENENELNLLLKDSLQEFE